jgi:hypothetical protein
MASAMLSMHGLTVSRPSAIKPKHCRKPEIACEYSISQRLGETKVETEQPPNILALSTSRNKELNSPHHNHSLLSRNHSKPHQRNLLALLKISARKP